MNSENGQISSGRRINADRDGKEKNARTRVKTILKGQPIYKSDHKTQENNFRTNNYERPAYNADQRTNRYEGENRSYSPKKIVIRKRSDMQDGEAPRTYGNRSTNNFSSGNRYSQRGDNNERPYQNRYNGSRNYENRRNDEYQDRRPRFQRDGNYNPDAKYTKKKQLEYIKREVDPTKPVRLNKFLANAGVCSRREADEFIQAGVITVNGNIISELGTKILPTDKVMFHDQPVRSERKVYILLNKPKDCVTTTEDEHDRTTVLDIVKHACSERIYPVGRLDRNTTGVLLLTNDGDLAAKLTHPKFEKKKIYHATLDKDLDPEAYNTIMSGITLDDEVIKVDALEFVKENDMKQVGIEIHSGQNRVVRRLFEKVGYKVFRLDRVFFAGLTKKNLPRGKYRFLTPREVNMLLMGAFE